jgi:hypothetical protein
MFSNSHFFVPRNFTRILSSIRWARQLRIVTLLVPAHTPAGSASIGRRQIKFQHSHDLADQAFYLAKRHSKHYSQDQRRLTGEVEVTTLAAGVVRGGAFLFAMASPVNQMVRPPGLRSDAF